MTLNSISSGNIKMQDSHPKISVVLTTYNRAEIVPQAIDSILHQTFKDFELIIVNDGSTDETQLILEDYTRKDSRIKILVQKNSGLAKARNHGVKHANGKYIAFMDDDDLSHPQRLERQLKYLLRHPGKDACVCLKQHITRDKSVNSSNANRITKVGKEWMPETPGNVKKNRIDILMPWTVLSPVTMINKSVFDQCGGYRPFFEYGEDFDFTLRYMEKFSIGVVPKYLYEYALPHKEFGGNMTTAHCDPLRGIKYITAAYLSAWCRRNEEIDPIAEEESDIENVVDKITLLPAHIRRHIFECLNYELRIFLSSPVLSAQDIIILSGFLKKLSRIKALSLWLLCTQKMHLLRQLLKRGKILDLLKLIRFGLTELFFPKNKKENNYSSK